MKLNEEILHLQIHVKLSTNAPESCDLLRLLLAPSRQLALQKGHPCNKIGQRHPRLMRITLSTCKRSTSAHPCSFGRPNHSEHLDECGLRVETHSTGTAARAQNALGPKCLRSDQISRRSVVSNA